MRILPTSLVVLIAGVAAPISAAPIVNPDFTTDLSGWIEGESVTWLDSDLDGCPSSGSIHLEHPAFDINPILTTQCVELVTSEAFTVEAVVSAPSLAPAQFAVFAHPGAGCTGDETILYTEISSTAQPTRVRLHFADAGSVQSIDVRLAALAWLDIFDVAPNATYDAIRIHPGDAVFVDGFEAGALCRWSDKNAGSEP